MDTADPAIELGAYTPSHCKFEPIEVCGHHRNLYGTVSAQKTRHDGSSSVDVAFQAYSVLANFKHCQELFSAMAPSRHATSISQTGSACWLLDASVKLHEYLTRSGTPDALTWDSAAAYLQQQSLLRGIGDGDIQLSHYFVFCLVGTMTCLYRPSKSGAISYNWRLFEIETCSATTSHSFGCYSNSTPYRLDTSFPIGNFLSGYGNILPLSDKNGRTSVDEEWILDPTKLNADILGNILKIGVTWTDTLGAHLDFDDVSNTLYLFRQATICLLNATPPEEGRTIVQSPDEVAQLMQEILLSVHVLYGQCPKSRRAFKEHQVFKEIPQRDRDRLLQSLCNGQADLTSFDRRQKRFYNIKTDFPLLGPRLLSLAKHAQSQEPTTLKQLWRDKRKTLQWWTFWAVIVFGSVSTVLSVAQTVLSAMQVHYAASDPRP
ncbi:uncharacterized protein PG986_004370 [Apiospora aurea]|uniref:Uncharacterized protein n=1 Tax=Apiospora aurea TaxID=335848 RepID=A0ABR1QMR2_9PEZI